MVGYARYMPNIFISASPALLFFGRRPIVISRRLWNRSLVFICLGIEVTAQMNRTLWRDSLDEGSDRA